ncbi:hypothetical protein ZWY2020_024527 [Hordeum vulgare]|nr:hypothetical protein ZWY2020_024527 [Hordeum vulgare]
MRGPWARGLTLSPAIPSHRNCSAPVMPPLFRLSYDTTHTTGPRPFAFLAPLAIGAHLHLLLCSAPAPASPHTVGHDSSVLHIAGSKGSTTAATKKLHP